MEMEVGERWEEEREAPARETGVEGGKGGNRGREKEQVSTSSFGIDRLSPTVSTHSGRAPSPSSPNCVSIPSRSMRFSSPSRVIPASLPSRLEHIRLYLTLCSDG